MRSRSGNGEQEDEEVGKRTWDDEGKAVENGRGAKELQLRGGSLRISVFQQHRQPDSLTADNLTTDN